MLGQYELTLARGLIDENGDRHRRARLLPLGGRAEARLGNWSAPLGPRSVSELLAASLERLGGYQPVSAEHTAALSRGDRQRLGLALRALMFGDRLVLTVDCPNPACSSQADLVLSVADLIGEPGEPQLEWLRLETADGEAWLRPPTGADDEACAGIENRDAAAALLWSRLLARLGEREALSADDWTALAPGTRHAIALALAERSQAPDLALLSRCPGCSAWLELLLDPFELLFKELRFGSARLLAEIHCLAFHYGWSETDILDLPRERRWGYLELLTRQLEGRPLSGQWQGQ